MTDLYMPLAAGGIAVLIAMVGFLLGRYAFPHRSKASIDLLAELRSQISRLESQFSVINGERERLVGERESLASRVSEADGRVAAFAERDKVLRERLDAEAAASERLLSSARVEFESIATRVMRITSESVSESSTRRLADIVDPLGARLGEFRDRIESIYSDDMRDRAVLQREIKQIAQAGLILGRQTEDLSKVLRVESRVQGQWGDVVLDRVLEHSGLKEHLLVRGGGEADAEGTRKPDAAIALPDGRHIVIDAKVPLDAYHAYANAQSTEERDQALKNLAQAIRAHVDRVAARDFGGIRSHEHVLMFVPAEGALAAAFTADDALFTHAWDKGVIIVSPTSLMMTLRTVSDVWRHEREQQDVRAIGEQAGVLHDEICTFLESLQALGASLEDAGSAYEDALRKLSTGPDSLIRRTSKLRTLASDPQRQIPPLHIQGVPIAELSEPAAAAETARSNGAQNSDAGEEGGPPSDEPRGEPETPNH